MICPHVIVRRPRAERTLGAPVVHVAPAKPPGKERLAREQMIRERAYLHAQRRGFAPGGELADWLAAEREVDHWLASRGAPARYGRSG